MCGTGPTSIPNWNPNFTVSVSPRRKLLGDNQLTVFFCSRFFPGQIDDGMRFRSLSASFLMKNYNRRRRYRVNSEEDGETRRGWNRDPSWEHQLEELGEVEWNAGKGQAKEGRMTSMELPLIPRSPCGNRDAMTSRERLTSKSSLPVNHRTEPIYFTEPRRRFPFCDPTDSQFDTLPDQDS